MIEIPKDTQVPTYQIPKDTQIPTYKIPTVSRCGECGLDISIVQGYICNNSKCPCGFRGASRSSNANVHGL